MMRLVVLACLLTAVAGKGAFLATDKNFDKDVIGSGKNAFVKFLAPWERDAVSTFARWRLCGDAVRGDACRFRALRLIFSDLF
eukprot:6096435-Pyramimonas_sp.AAC.1